MPTAVVAANAMQNTRQRRCSTRQNVGRLSETKRAGSFAAESAFTWKHRPLGAPDLRTGDKAGFAWSRHLSPNAGREERRNVRDAQISFDVG
jgi:hypothetical protein